MAGRVLSKKNEGALRAALEQIGAVLAALSEDEDGEKADAKTDAKGKAKEAAADLPAANLDEAANLGAYLEADLHTGLIGRVNGMFAEGRLNRAERDALIAAASAAIDAFRLEVEGGAASAVYSRTPWQDAPDPQAAGDVQEAGDLAGDFVPLSEAAVRGDGTALLKIIAPGWGSSGYYPKEVLKRDGPTVFRTGLKGFWDHPTATEEAERPEGSLTLLASELVSDAQWQDNGPAGPGLYAQTRVFKPYVEAVNELAPHIGVSIRAAGRTAQGEAEGRKGPIVQQLVAARSVDWVTMPGAGGQVVQMFEAARNGARANVPAQSEHQDQGGQMADKELEGKLSEAQTEIARLREAMIVRDARDAVRESLAGALVPDVTKARLLEQLAANPPVADGNLDRVALATRVAEAVKAEQDYLVQAAGYGSGRVQGMGASAAAPAAKPEEQAAKMREAFAALGLTEKEAEIATNGRLR